MTSNLKAPSLRSFLAGVALMAAVAVMAHLVSTGAEAQQPAPLPGSTVEVAPNRTFGLAKVDEIVPRRSDIVMREVIPMGRNNAFIVAYNKMLVVFRVDHRGNTVRNIRLGEIPLLGAGYSDIREIVVLDDQQSFLVRTNNGIAVWAVTHRDVVPVSR